MPEQEPPIVIADPSVPLLHVSLAAAHGATNDPEGKEGATRLLLRLMRRSVQGISPEDVDGMFDALGATLGIDVSRSVAGLHGGCITRSSDAFLSLLCKVVTQPQFDAGEFARLVEESQAEWRDSLDNDSAIARRFFARAMFEGHPYGRLASGTHASLGRITLDDLTELYPRVFSSNGLKLSMSGDVTESLARQLFAQLAGALPNSPAPAPLLIDPVGPQGRHLTFVDKPGRTQTQILMGCLGTHTSDEDHTALFVGHTIFGGTFSARLSREVRGKRGWSYGAYSDLPFDQRRQGFSLWTFPQASDAADCIRLELAMLAELIDKGVTDEELAAAKLYLTNSHVFTLDTASKRASMALDRRLYDLPEDFHSGYLDRIAALSVNDVNEALKRRLSATDLEITVLGTHDDIGSEIEGAIEDLSGTTVIPFDQED